jgi:hypothetical protein
MVLRASLSACVDIRVGRSYLIADMRLECGSGEWMQYMPLAAGSHSCVGEKTDTGTRNSKSKEKTETKKTTNWGLEHV